MYYWLQNIADCFFEYGKEAIVSLNIASRLLFLWMWQAGYCSILSVPEHQGFVLLFTKSKHKEEHDEMMI